ncbi:hypothetical protein GWI33_021371 [Rhynchophorus ferrugineus]|uniref:Uncharacterized protein n=1 Tax=Rhynchophorus ferrugineus TaxID=354439 RepID=A0A834HP66_RHYFE|nr:hypothetical protein GWI33_021371 [Rhynchophorus ferrugineus]
MSKKHVDNQLISVSERIEFVGWFEESAKNVISTLQSSERRQILLGQSPLRIVNFQIVEKFEMSPKRNLTLVISILVLLLRCFSLIAASPQRHQINEPNSYEAKLIPNNVQQARQSLGYDNFQRVPSRTNSAKKFAWEEFDTPNVHFNF